MKILITTSTFGKFEEAPLKLLQDSNLDFTLNPYGRTLNEEEVSEILKKEEYVGVIAGTETINENVLANGEKIRVISRVGVGMDNIDLMATEKRKIKLFNTPDVLVDSVSELTLSFILNGLRKLSTQDRKIREGKWEKQMGSLLAGKIVGLIGFGKIGKRVAKLLKAFDANVIFTDPIKMDSEEYEQVSLTRLLRESDIISIHSSSKKTLISKNEINQMKKNVILVNTSRGFAIDEAALIEALKENKIGFAALDVFEKEPYSGSLTNFDNILLTPHIGSYAKEARCEMEKQSVTNLIQGLKEAKLL